MDIAAVGGAVGVVIGAGDVFGVGLGVERDGQACVRVIGIDVALSVDVAAESIEEEEEEAETVGARRSVCV